MSRRELIRMSDEEVAGFLAHERTMTCASNGVRGWPHLMPLWFTCRPADGDPPVAGGGRVVPDIWAWTYAASQKTRNLERDARATVQVEAGESYDQLRGVMLETDVVLHRETQVVSAFGRELFARYGAPKGEPPLAELAEAVTGMIDGQAPKRVVLQFVPRRWATWDHRKLGGVY
jgi:Pyridoxamine 5'-phosphate oxidase